MIYNTSLSHPYMFSTISGKTMLDTSFEAINRRLKLLLLTGYNEMFMNPNLGCGLYETTFDYADEPTYIVIRDMICDSIDKFEKSIEVTKDMIDISMDNSTNHIKITINYRVRNTDLYGSTDLGFEVN